MLLGPKYFMCVKCASKSMAVFNEFQNKYISDGKHFLFVLTDNIYSGN